MKKPLYQTGPLLRAGINLYKSSFPAIWPLALIAALFNVLPPMLLMGADSTAAQIGRSLIPLLALWPLSALVYQLDDGRYLQPSLLRGLRQVLPRLPKLLPGLALFYLTIRLFDGLVQLAPDQSMHLLAGLLMLIPAFTIGMLLCPFLPAIIVDDAGPLEALGWCWIQTCKHWRTTVAVVLTPFLVMGGLMMLVGMVLGFIMLLGDNSQFELFDRLTGLFNNLIVALLTPLILTNLVVLYHRLKDTPERIKLLDRRPPQTRQ